MSTVYFSYFICGKKSTKLKFMMVYKFQMVEMFNYNLAMAELYLKLVGPKAVTSFFFI